MAITNVNNSDNRNTQISSSGTTGTSASTSGSATGGENPSIINVKKPKEELLKQLGLTAEQYLEICTNNPSFETLPIDKQLEFVGKMNSQKSAGTQNAQQNEAGVETNDPNQKQPSGLFFDKAAFAKQSETPEDVSRKINTYVQEYAKNTFMFADEKNQKTPEDWDALSDEEKANYIKNAKSILNAKFGEVLQGSSMEAFDMAIDGMMTDLLAANSLLMRIDTFYNSDTSVREEAVYSYLNEVDLMETSINSGSSLSKLDQIRLQKERLLVASVSELTGRDNLCPNDAKYYLTKHNLTEYQVEETYLTNKKANGEELSQYETYRLKELQELKKSPTFNQAIKEAKYQGLQNLKAMREDAIAEGKESLVKELDETLNSKESQEIEKWGAARAQEKIEPSQEYEDFLSSNYGKLYEGSSTASPNQRAAIIMAYLNEHVPKEERAQTYLKLVQGVQSEGPQSIDLHIKLLEIGLQNKDFSQAIAKEAELSNLNIANNNNVKAKVNIDESVQSIIYKRNAKKLKNSRSEEEKQEYTKIITESLSVQKEHGNDKSKTNAIKNYSELSGIDDIGIELNETNISITDKKTQRDNIERIIKNASENVKIHGAVNAHRLLEGNQAYGLGIYTQDSQAATEAAAKSGVYSKFAESEQLEGFKITNQRIDELFNGQEKIDLLKTNSDYIENCAIENQSEMYEVALNSKYSEVTDYVSAKIESSNNQVLDIVSNLNADYKAVTGNDIEVYDSAGTVSNIVAEFKAAMEQNDTQRQIQLLGKIPSNMLSSAISKISMYNVNLLATFVRLGRGNELLKIPGMSSDVTSKVIHLMLNSSLKDQKVAAKYVIDNKNYFSKTTLERCQELLHDNKNNTYTSAPMGGVKSALQPSMSAIYPGKKQMFYKA